jgi:hypothetical protein
MNKLNISSATIELWFNDPEAGGGIWLIGGPDEPFHIERHTNALLCHEGLYKVQAHGLQSYHARRPRVHFIVNENGVTSSVLPTPRSIATNDLTMHAARVPEVRRCVIDYVCT